MKSVVGAAAAVAAVLTCTAACGSWSSRDAASGDCGTPRIELVSSSKDGTEAIEVIGIPDNELEDLRGRTLTDQAWASLLRVSVAMPEAAGGETPLAMVGTYTVTDRRLRFQPRFLLDPGRPYQVVFDPSVLPSATESEPLGCRAAPISAIVSAPARAATAPARVLEIYPTTPDIPANQLRLYISFSTPMSNARTLEHVNLLDEAGRPVEGAFLPFLDVAMWNADRTRFTVLFDPGRVKQGIQTNEQLGRALEDGRTYTLVVDAGLLDANGAPLASEYRRSFSVGPADTKPLDPTTWRLSAPPVGGREPLVAAFSEPLDHALLHRALIVSSGDGRPVEGTVGVDVGERRWRFMPAGAWQAGDYRLTALPILEDGAGNQIGRPFEVDTSENDEGFDEPRAVSLSFRVEPAGPDPVSASAR